MSDLPKVLVHGDGVHDDAAALELIVNGKAVGILPDGTLLADAPPRKYAISRKIVVKEPIENVAKTLERYR